MEVVRLITSPCVTTSASFAQCNIIIPEEETLMQSYEIKASQQRHKMRSTRLSRGPRLSRS